jgi:predicted phosphoribosyltransferase
MMFRDRVDAGRRLAPLLAHLAGRDTTVLALPRGGVPVAREIARALRAPLDLLLVRKIGTPGQPELAAGAIVDAAEPIIVRNEDVIRAYGVSETAFAAVAERERAELARRRRRYLGDREPLTLRGRQVVIVDDGIATGATVRAAIEAVRAAGAASVTIAAPVAAADTAAKLRKLADGVIALEEPQDLFAIGAYYRDFRQLDDEEVTELLETAELS